jgi:23S rRNA pseudouridine2605 synthase
MQERLQKLIAEAGIASRRKAEQMIVDGQVAVNGEVVTELGTKADPAVDSIKVDGRSINGLLERRALVYVLLNKPRGYLSSTADPQQRPLAIDLLPQHVRKGLHTVGRLDFNTEGLLILTNDGALTEAVTRAGRVPKVYHAKVKGHPSGEQIARLRRGVTVDDRRTRPAEVDLIEATEADNAWYRVVLREGRNQQIRKMFDAIGHSVVKLRRTQIGPIDDANLPVGVWRYLTESEVKRLMSGRAPASPRTPVRGGKPGGPTRRKEGPQRARGARTSRAGRDKKGRV